MEVKIFTGYTSDVEKKLNGWLKTNSHSVIDIKYACTEHCVSAMVMYRINEH